MICSEEVLVSLIFLCFILPAKFYGQNLVLNPSFEEHTACPTTDNIDSHHEVELIIDWTTPTVSSDYFHECGDEFSGVPSNTQFGFQYARTGQAYAGYSHLTLFGSVTNAGEYLQATFAQALEKDSFYMVELYVSLRDNVRLATDEFSLLFTDTLLQVEMDSLDDTSRRIFAQPQLNNEPGNYLSSREEWMPLRWVYQANGGEAYMTMGVFRDEAFINYIELEQWGSSSIYFFVDDVRVEKLPANIGDLGLRDTILCEQPFEVELKAPGIHEAYFWSTGDTSLAITVNEPGVYVLEAAYQEFTIRDTAVVQYLPPDSISLGPDTSLCVQDLPFRLPGPYGLPQYQWSNGDTTPYATITQPGWYALEADYACGMASDSVYITVEAVEPFSLGPDTLLCTDTPFSFALQAGTGYDNYLWSTGTTTASIEVVSPGTYWVEATHSCGIEKDTIRLSQEALLSLGLPSDTLVCEGDSVWLSASAGFEQYQWSHGPAAMGAWLSGIGQYSLSASYACGVEYDTVLVATTPLPTLELPEIPVSPLGSQIQLPGPDGYNTYEWWPASGLSCTGCPKPLLIPIAPTTYYLEVQDEYGCHTVDSVEVIVEPRARVYAPTAFSPNGDGYNDRFELYTGPEVAQITTLEVYSRWGGQVYVYEPSGGLPAWDGYVEGEMAPAGLYLWVARLRLLNGQEVDRSGEVLLVR